MWPPVFAGTATVSKFAWIRDAVHSLGVTAGTNTIRRANLDGSGQETLLRNLPEPRRIALDLTDGKMYFADAGSGTVRRANFDGSGQETLVGGLPRPIGLDLDLVGGKMYWSHPAGGVTGAGDIRRANLAPGKRSSGVYPCWYRTGPQCGLWLVLAHNSRPRRP